MSLEFVPWRNQGNDEAPEPSAARFPPSAKHHDLTFVDGRSSTSIFFVPLRPLLLFSVMFGPFRPTLSLSGGKLWYCPLLRPVSDPIPITDRVQENSLAPLRPSKTATAKT